jgi:galactokinase
MLSPKATVSTQEMRKQFEARYGGPFRLFRAPGRVNLIGEHTDYNDGFVMPAAIGFYTMAAIGPRPDRKIRVHSINFDEAKEFDLDALGEGPTGHWSDYVRGVAAVLEAHGHRLSGANLVIQGDVPVGAGLSSSAAIEVATAFALLGNSNLTLDRLDIARACQQAEHRYVGTKCGIMDQFISCFGEAHHALMLDCRILEFQTLKIDRNMRLVICNTMVKHELAGGEYNLRRADCEAGVRYLQQYLPDIRALRDVTLDELQQYGHNMPDVVHRRCRHVVTENARVLAATEALRTGDLGRFGDLMGESHLSLRDDYEVSCKELDLMVELARKCRGVYGARMTGGGFGGCTVNLVSAENAMKFKQTIEREYLKATRVQPDVYICEASAGAGEISEDAAA